MYYLLGGLGGDTGSLLGGGGLDDAHSHGLKKTKKLKPDLKLRNINKIC